MGPEDYNDACDDDEDGTSEDDTSGSSDTRGDDTRGESDTIGYEIRGVVDANGAGVGCDDWGVMGDDDEVVQCCDNRKGAFDDGKGLIANEKPPKYELWSMIIISNDAFSWRFSK